MEVKRVKIHITGVVQGVGFRPTVYKYAQQFSLTGHVSNTSQGVFLEIQGPVDNIDVFISHLRQNPPPIAKIDKFMISPLPPISTETHFEIQISHHHGEKNVLITADLATCSQCLADILDPQNRRYRYPFTNCTNCGPRFSIISDRPYDRPLTAMKDFLMCSECQKEYHNPASRRFHAQPNCCPNCGPQLSLIKNTNCDPLRYTVRLLQQGKIVAIKGLGGFNICVDAYNLQAVQQLRCRKQREFKSFALMAKNIEEVKKYCCVDSLEEQLLHSSAAPIVLLRKRDSTFNHISPDNNYLGVMLPYTPLHHLLMQHFSFIVITSANKRDEPIAIDNLEIKQMIYTGFIDDALIHNREIINRADDSILQVINNQIQFIRRSRGYTPLPLQSPISAQHNYLALGANMKNCFALSKKQEITLSQHIGELLDYRNLQYQQQQITKLQQLLTITPKVTICDAHPQYENYSSSALKVFHHHAHFLAVLAEHQLLRNPNILGIIADGTGYGTDETIWGFEFLVQHQNDPGFKRLGSLLPFTLYGGEKAIYEIERIAYALIPEHLISNKQKLHKFHMAVHNIQTSSLGRLFDGVAAILHLCITVEYEAQGAIKLQQLAEQSQLQNFIPYPVNIQQQDIWRIDYQPMINQLLSDLQQNVSQSDIAFKFHQWIVDTIFHLTKLLNFTNLALAGGCFQNRLLLELIEQRASQLKINIFWNHHLPLNDAGIAYGQIVHAQQKEQQCV